MDAVGIWQVVAAILSVPVVTAVGGFVARAFRPAERLRSVLKTDPALYKEMPESEARNSFREHIDRSVALLNVRLRPERWTRRRQIAQGIFGLIGAFVALIFAFILIFSSFVLASSNGTVPIVSAVLFGAGATAALASYWRDRRRRDEASAPGSPDSADVGSPS